MAQGVLTRGKGDERIPVASLCQPRRLGQQGHSSDRWPLPGHVLNYRETHRASLRESTHTILGKVFYVCDSKKLFTARQKMESGVPSFYN